MEIEMFFMSFKNGILKGNHCELYRNFNIHFIFFFQLNIQLNVKNLSIEFIKNLNKTPLSYYFNHKIDQK